MPGLVAAVVGSQSDWETLARVSQTIDGFAVAHDVRVLSAYRTPGQLVQYVEAAERDGVEVIIAGAGRAAALPGAIAPKTTVPVLGVPIESKLNGFDSLLSNGADVRRRAGGHPRHRPRGRRQRRVLAVPILASKRPELSNARRRCRRTQGQRKLEHPDPGRPRDR